MYGKWLCLMDRVGKVLRACFVLMLVQPDTATG